MKALATTLNKTKIRTGRRGRDGYFPLFVCFVGHACKTMMMITRYVIRQSTLVFVLFVLFFFCLDLANPKLRLHIKIKMVLASLFVSKKPEGVQYQGGVHIDCKDARNG